MTTRGTLNGLGAGTWTKFQPRLICPGGTDPTFSDYTGVTGAQAGTAPLGKYVALPNGDINVQYQWTFFSDSTFGSGTYYAVQLPFPAQRFAFGGDNYAPLGVGHAYRSALDGVSASFHMDVTPMLAPASDPNMTARDDPDRYFVCLVPKCFDYGTATISGGSNAVTVNHNIGFAFDAADINFEMSAGNRGTSSNVLNHLQITSITSTQFTAQVGTDTTTGTIPFSYKIKTDAMPSGSYAALMSPTQPFSLANLTNGVSLFGNFFLSLKYTPRR